MMNRARSALLLLLVLALSGCGIFGEHDPETDPMRLEDFDESLNVRKLWSRSAGAGLGKSAPGLVPFYADGRIWTADYKGRIASFDARTGDRLQQFDLDMQLSAGPTVLEDRVLVGTINGQIVVVNRRTGAVEWRAQLSSEILASPVQSDGVLVVRCIDGRVFGLNPETGRRAWVYDRSVPLLTLRGNSRPLVRGGQVFIGHDDGTVTALDLADGDLLWEQRVSTPEGRTELERLADIDGRMAIVGLDLFAITIHGRMASLALDSGRLLWVKDLASYSGLSVGRTRLAVTDLGDRIWLLDRRSGSTQWSNEQLLRRDVTRPAIQGSFVVVADGEGYLHWLNADTGEFAARERATRDAPAAAPLVVDNTVYLLDVDGGLSAWRIGAGS